jgi:hypothetical protein
MLLYYFIAMGLVSYILGCVAGFALAYVIQRYP